MPEDGSKTRTEKIEHFIYGSFKGYCMKAKSPGVDQSAVEEAIGSNFIPIAQGDFKYVEDVRVLLPFDEETIMVSRIYPAGRDDHGRGTVANHTALVPRKFMRWGYFTYEDINRALIDFEQKHPNAQGKLEPLTITGSKKKLDASNLANHLSRATTEEVLGRFIRTKGKAKVVVKYKGRTQERIEALFGLAEALDLMLSKVRVAGFSDLPYSQNQGMFNLIVSRVRIDLKAGGDWVEVDPASPKKPGVNFNSRTQKVLSSIYDGGK